MTPGRLLEIAEQHPPELDITALAKAIAREAREEALEEAERVCERDLCNRPDDHVANYFDGGLRHCVAAIRALRGEAAGRTQRCRHGKLIGDDCGECEL